MTIPLGGGRSDCFAGTHWLHDKDVPYWLVTDAGRTRMGAANLQATIDLLAFARSDVDGDLGRSSSAYDRY